MKILGIDPGKTGGLALADRHKVILAEIMPEHVSEIADLILAWEVTHIYLEKAQSMPKQGVASVFTYGAHYGEIVGIVRSTKLPIRFVAPREWAKIIHKGTKAGTAKDRSREAAMNLYPHLNLKASDRAKKIHEGMMDACHIANFGRLELTVGT